MGLYGKETFENIMKVGVFLRMIGIMGIGCSIVIVFIHL